MKTSNTWMVPRLSITELKKKKKKKEEDSWGPPVWVSTSLQIPTAWYWQRWNISKPLDHPESIHNSRSRIFSEHMTTCIWKSIICFINISNISQILSAVFKKILIESIFQHFSAQVGWKLEFQSFSKHQAPSLLCVYGLLTPCKELENP